MTLSNPVGRVPFPIAQNDELWWLQRALGGAGAGSALPEVLIPGGRLAVLSFHAIEVGERNICQCYLRWLIEPSLAAVGRTGW